MQNEIHTFMSSILEEWNAARDRGIGESLPGPSQAGDSPLCSVDSRLQSVSRGRGYPVAFSCSKSKIYIATSRNYIIQHDEETGLVAEVEFSKNQHCTIRRLFVDPMGESILILVQQGVKLDVSYMNENMIQDHQKPLLLKELKGVNVTSVTWYYRGRNQRAGAVLGTDIGSLYGIDCIDHVLISKKIVKLMELPRPRGKTSPISGLGVVQLGMIGSEQGILLLVLCGTHLHMYRHLKCQSITGMFLNGADVETRLFDLPIEHDAAQLQLFRPSSSFSMDILEYPTRFAILSASGIYYGNFRFERDCSTEDLMDYLVSHKLLPASVLVQNSNSNERPISLALTQYHIILLYPSRINVINIESRQTVQEIPVDSFAVPMQSAPALPLGLTRDVIDGQLMVLAGDNVYEIDYTNEDRDMWKTYLLKGDFKSALSHCRTEVQRNAIYSHEAERLFEEGKYEDAATLLGKSTSNHPTFDQITSRFMGLNEGNPMCKFLESRLETLGNEDRIQSTMMSAWLLELLLDKANKRALECNVTDNEVNEDVQKFLNKHVDLLDPGTTVSILQDYGRNKELIVYAQARGDEVSQVELLIHEGDFERAVQILRKPSLGIDLIYKYSQTLLNASPRETVSLWMDIPQLDPVRLLPSMMHLAEEHSSYTTRREVIRYIKFCLDVKRVSDPVMNDFGISLLILEPESEIYLLEKLDACKNATGKPLYDPVRALRLCIAMKRKVATVHLLQQVSLWEDAVDKALEFDYDLAKSVAKRYPGQDQDVQRELWISIIKSLLKKNEDDPNRVITAITEIVNDANGSLSIDDVLELLPEFERMGKFKTLICESFNRCSHDIRAMKSEIAMAVDSNTKLRHALESISKPTLFANASLARCISCARLINERPPISAGPSGGMLPRYYAFPTGNMYHGACLCCESSKLATPDQKDAIESLSKSLARIHLTKDTKIPDVEQLRSSLHQHIAVQDPFCGENVSRYVTKPFVDMEDLEKEAWTV